MSNPHQADDPRPARDPDPAAPPPSAPPPQAYQPPSYTPGYAALPEPPPDYPPTAQFPAVPGYPPPAGPAGHPPPGGPVNYAPPGSAPDYGQGYPPPGQPPSGYPAPPHPQQGYLQQPYPQQPYPPQPGAPPRRSNAPLIAVIVAVTLLLCGGAATATVMAVRAATDKAKEAIEPLPDLPTLKPELPGLPTDLPTGVPGASRKITVTYEVTGDGPAQILYLNRLGATPSRLQNVKLPWKFTAEVDTPALLSVTAMRVDTTDGSISCRALVDGEEVEQRTSSNGTFATASCTHFAIE